MRHFAGDFYQRVADASGNTLGERFKLYVGSRLLGEIVRSGGPDKTLYFHQDHLGSPDTITNDIDSTVDHLAFGPFGEDLPNSDTSVTRSGFTGHDHDRDLGLIDMRGRIYDPLAGSFASADPITQAPFFSQGLNQYAYVFNDPINMTDPSGFFGCDWACLPAPTPQGGIDWSGIFGGGNVPGGGSGGPAAAATQAVFNVLTTLSMPTSSTTTTVRMGTPGVRAPGGGQATQGAGGGAMNQNAPLAVPVKPPTDTTGWLAGPGADPPGGDFAIWEDEVRANAYGQAALEHGGVITSKEGLARVADFAARLTKDPATFVNLLGRALAKTSMADPGVPRGPEPIPDFGSSGFRPEYREMGNQVRHFTGGFVAGARYGGRMGSILNTGRELSTLGNGASMADVRLGNAAAHRAGVSAP